ELQYLATWVKEQHAQEYILTWLLTQPGVWWSNGEVYKITVFKAHVFQAWDVEYPPLGGVKVNESFG
ncbi:MAG: hypothetical protein ACKPFF_28505, partial [Planktothrix sp.]